MENLKDIISKLKFIGKIQKGDKINVKYLYVQPKGVVTTISRSFFYQDNRGNTLSFLENVITKTLEIISNYENTDDHFEKVLCNNIVKDLVLSKNGFDNLKETYIEDIKFCCDIDTLIQLINIKLKILIEEDCNLVEN